MPMQFIETEPRRNRSAPLTVTLSVAKNGSRSGRLSSGALAALRTLVPNGNPIRVRVGLDGKRVALVIDAGGREVSQSGSFTGYELSRALGDPAASVKHHVQLATADNVTGLWIGGRVALKADKA